MIKIRLSTVLLNKQILFIMLILSVLDCVMKTAQ